MLPQNNPDRIQITFDDPRLVANAGLLLPATLARHLGLPEFVRQRLDLGNAPGRAATALTPPMRSGGTAGVLGCMVKAPSTPRLREGRLWGRSCAASGGATSASWTG